MARSSPLTACCGSWRAALLHTVIRTRQESVGPRAVREAADDLTGIVNTIGASLCRPRDIDRRKIPSNVEEAVRRTLRFTIPGPGEADDLSGAVDAKGERIMRARDIDGGEATASVLRS